MFNEHQVLNDVSEELSNFVYLYGGEGYFTSIENNCFEIEIYNISSKEINEMSSENALKHLISKVSIDFSDCIQMSQHLLSGRIVDKVIAKLKEDK